MSSNTLWLLIDVNEDQEVTNVSGHVTRTDAVEQAISEAVVNGFFADDPAGSLAREGVPEDKPHESKAGLRNWLQQHDSYTDGGVRVSITSVEIPT